MRSILSKVFVLLVFSLFCITTYGQQIVLPDAQKEESDAETVIIEAKKNVFAGKYDVAIKMLEKLLSNDRTNAVVAIELAKVYHEKKDWEGVKRYAEIALKNDPDNVYFLEYFTNLINEQPYDPVSEKYFNQLISLPVAKERHFDNYLSYLISNNRQSSAKVVMDKMQVRFGETEKILQRSYEICNFSDCKEKENIIKKLLAKDNSNVGYKKLLAQYYLTKNKQKDAVNIYKEILAISPNDTEANLAVLKTTNDKKSAESAYLRTIIPLIKNQNIPIDEKVKELLPYLTALVEKNDTTFRAELSDIGQTLSLTHPAEAKAQAFYGDILYSSGQYKGAVQQYQKTLKLNNKVFGVWKNLMHSLEMTEDLAELDKTANQAIDFFPNNVESYIILGKSYIKQNKMADARDILSEALPISGGNQLYLKELNPLLELAKKDKTLDELITQYEELVKEDKLPAEIYILLGEAAKKEGKPDIALPFFRKAKALGYPTEYFFLKGIKLDF